MRAIAVAVALSVPACTLVGLSAGATTAKVHNELSDDDWSYGTPALVGAGLGLIVDIVFILYMQKQWSKPMT